MLICHNMYALIAPKSGMDASKGSILNTDLPKIGNHTPDEAPTPFPNEYYL